MFPKMSSSSLAVRFRQSVTRDALRAYLAEFISTFFFTFTVVGSVMSSRELTPDAAVNPASLVVVSMATAFGLSTAVCISAGVSGGHVNPAVTFGMAVGGRISVPTALFYWIFQLFGSTMACLLLKATTAGEQIPAFKIAESMTGFGASLMEAVLTFALVYTVYVTVGGLGNGWEKVLGPLAIGLVAGACVLASGPFSGGSMNPACAFGSAIVSGKFKNQAVYWVGPLIGAAVAGLLYDCIASPLNPECAPDTARV